MQKKSFKYREAVHELNNILEYLQSEDIDVDELTTKVKRATELIKTCRQKIQKTEFEIKNILKKFEAEETIENEKD